MNDDSDMKRGQIGKAIGWSIPASILLHAILGVALFVRVPLDLSEPQKEEIVQVEIVPPPEPEKPPEKPPEQPPELKLPEPKPEEPKPPEPKPEEPKPEEPKKEEPKPEEPKKEEQKPPEPPPKPPEAPKPAEPPPPPPPPRPPPEQKPEEPPAADEQAKQSQLQMLRPVVEFGDKDSGPKKSEDGDASQEAAKAPVDPPPEEPPGEAPDQAPDEAAEADKPPANPVPDDIAVPEVGLDAVNPQLSGPLKGTSPDDTKTDFVTAPKPAEAKKTNDVPKAGKPVELAEAKRLFSRSETGDPFARTAMGNLPRELRASQLCSTELREQLRHASPPYNPEIVPSPRLPKGTVMDVRRAAFRANQQWYDLSFRCELDDNATKVLSFAFDVGAAIPRGEWRKRGFPEF
jgi:hypothetical protein